MSNEMPFSLSNPPNRGALAAEGPGIRDIDEQLVHQQALEHLDPGLVLWPHPDLGAPG